MMKGGSLKAMAAEPLPENTVVEQNIVDIDAVAEAIKRLQSSTKFKAKLAAVAVAGSAVITKIIEVPASLKENQIEEQLLMDADQYIPYPLDEVALDFQVLEPTARSEGMVDVMICCLAGKSILSPDKPQLSCQA